MSQTLTIAEMTQHFAEYTERVASRGEHFVLVQGSTPIAEVRPLPAGRRLADLPALCASLPHPSPTDAAKFASDRTEA